MKIENVKIGDYINLIFDDQVCAGVVLDTNFMGIALLVEHDDKTKSLIPKDKIDGVL
jgi:hypothetical protein